ncbi:MAG: ATP-dependent Clp protease proteolytic subunit [Candidatus Tectomicrobia bacterium]|uniref:ATP-dependent Clp protease proteolytic subunit n=1 Tax=Tectimicrobiota bacterium TaxID=2528274 RepID=A0A932MMM4_UNCTE|nr:ATP-dependent Clp protease proteolytic subunit [Candidatus Tectomicrobia bacterium]
MNDDKISNVLPPPISEPADPNGNPGKESEPGGKADPQPSPGKGTQIPWHEFVQNASDYEIQNRFSAEVNQIFVRYAAKLADACVVALMDLERSIDDYELDRIYNALKTQNPSKQKNVILFLLSRGGKIESAYQISKLCKTFSKQKFIVCVPRQAKSAGTLIAIGADEIHMGLLGQLGPIDPQLGHPPIPALGVTQALEAIAKLSNQYPGCSEMFAEYLRNTLTIAQIGYCERVSESAAQYAERLLLTKPNLKDAASKISNELVYEYKDHGFVIDIEEAKRHLGDDWIVGDSALIELAEEVYSLFDLVNLFLEVRANKYLIVGGSFNSDVYVFDKPQRAN